MIGCREYRDEKSTERMEFERGVERMGSGCDGDGTFPIDLAILSASQYTPSHPFFRDVERMGRRCTGMQKGWGGGVLGCRKDGKEV